MKQITTTSLSFSAEEVLEALRLAYEIPADASINGAADVTVTYTVELE